jgi:hypothetical protein
MNRCSHQLFIEIYLFESVLAGAGSRCVAFLYRGVSIIKYKVYYIIYISFLLQNW